MHPISGTSTGDDMCQARSKHRRYKDQSETVSASTHQPPPTPTTEDTKIKYNSISHRRFFPGGAQTPKAPNMGGRMSCIPELSRGELRCRKGQRWGVGVLAPSDRSRAAPRHPKLGGAADPPSLPKSAQVGQRLRRPSLREADVGDAPGTNTRPQAQTTCWGREHKELKQKEKPLGPSLTCRRGPGSMARPGMGHRGRIRTPVPQPGGLGWEGAWSRVGPGQSSSSMFPALRPLRPRPTAFIPMVRQRSGSGGCPGRGGGPALTALELSGQ